VTTRGAAQIADAVLYEGYVLYPYRASAPKNRVRWQVGLVAPRVFSETVASDPWFTQTECLAEWSPGAALTVRVRCLQVQERTIEQRLDDRSDRWQPVDRLVVDGQPLISWDEAVACEFVRERVLLDNADGEQSWAWTLDAAAGVDPVRDTTGRLAARIVRHRRPLVAMIRVATSRHGSLVKVRLRVENVTSCGVTALAGRDEAVRQSLAGTHAILAIEGGAFVSLLEPPHDAVALAASCVNIHTFPVLAGPAGSRDVMLSSPIILYDYPAVAPESLGDLCDGTEIDELLTLRVRTLTDDEKREARATDARAAQIIDRCDAASADDIGQLHGTSRSFESFLNPPDEPQPEEASVTVGGRSIARGSHVRLQPGRVTDSLDICLAGRTGIVSAVYRTLEDQPYVAVTLDDDPFAAEGAKYRRSLFFHPHELVPVEGGAE
jgi:hypothetical protein